MSKFRVNSCIANTLVSILIFVLGACSSNDNETNLSSGLGNSQAADGNLPTVGGSDSDVNTTADPDNDTFGGAQESTSSIAGFWDFSDYSDGSQDLLYMLINSNGEFIEYEYDYIASDDPDDDCWWAYDGAIEALGNNQYVFLFDYGNGSYYEEVYTMQRSGNTLQTHISDFPEMRNAYPLLDGVDPVFNEC